MKETRVEHQWGSWVYRHEQTCDQGIQCTRCEIWAQDSRVEHEWGDWEYQEEYRASMHACRRCSTVASYFPEQIVQTPAEEIAPDAAEPVPSDFGVRCDAILAEFERGLNEKGFSEYLMGQATAGLQELQPESDDEVGTLRAALVRMIDLAIPHAPPEAAQIFLVSRESILQQDAPPQPPLDSADLKVEGEAVLKRLRDDLEAGGLPGPAVIRAQTGFQNLGSRIRDGDDEAGKVLLGLMPQIMDIVQPYVEPDKATLAAEATATMQETFAEAEAALDDDPARAEVAAQAAMRQMKRFAQSPTTDPWEQATALAHQRQFTALLRPWMDRIVAISSPCRVDAGTQTRSTRDAGIAGVPACLPES